MEMHQAKNVPLKVSFPISFPAFIITKWIPVVFMCVNVLHYKFADVPMPPTHKLTMSEVFDETGKPRQAVLRSHFIEEGRIEGEVALRIIRDATVVLRKERNVLEVDAPITGQ